MVHFIYKQIEVQCGLAKSCSSSVAEPGSQIPAPVFLFSTSCSGVDLTGVLVSGSIKLTHAGCVGKPPPWASASLCVLMELAK